MALLHSLEKQGNTLFRYRSYIPLVLLIPAIPVIYYTPASGIVPEIKCWINILAILLSLLGIIIRAATIATTPKGTSGRNTEKQLAESLNSKGIYSIVRHPLYLGNFFMWIGIVVFIWNIWFCIIISLAFWIYYERIMFAEERFLERQFGEEYLKWSLQAPAFIPDFSLWKKSDTPFSIISILRREYSGWLATAICFGLIELLRNYFEIGKLYLSKTEWIAILLVAIIALILRTLKHHTKLLHEEGRS